MTDKTDIIVIGGGPGGYPAAIRASQLGKKVTLIEKGMIGGECLNLGCIPSKALLSATKLLDEIKHKAPDMGISTGKVSVNMKKMHEWRIGVQEKLVSGVEQLLKANDVEVVAGTARFKGPQQLEVSFNAGGHSDITADDVIIASGADFHPPEGMSFDGTRILSPYQALSMNSHPTNVLIVGAGDLGLELATLMRRFGSDVSIVGSVAELFSKLDARTASVVKQDLRQAGIELMLNARIAGIELTEDAEVKTTLTSEKGDTNVLTVNCVILTTGKRPNTTDLGLKEIGIDTTDNGAIIIDDKQQTSKKHHYAIGDCTGPPYLAQRATKQGIVAAEVAAGIASRFDYRAMPRLIFSEPEIAFVGLNETEAKAAGFDIVSGQASFAASGRALTEDEASGVVRIIADAKSSAVLGAQLVGPRATDLISEMSFALEMGSLLEDLSFTSHPHPTLPEMIMEAAASAQGKAINVANSRRTK
jgi:dihydrolipoamide dehydrogenase